MKERMPGGPRRTITSLTVMVKAIERRLWPTPEASDATGGRVSKELGGTRPSGTKRAVTLGTAVSWPTPTANDWKNAGYQKGANGNTFPTLPGAVGAAKRWPTPTARLGDQRGPQAKRYFDPARSNDLDDAVAASGATGQLNPTWVEWLMGFPLGWTDLEPSATP